jgi:membrane-associated phospholipid phosphatase
VAVRGKGAAIHRELGALAESGQESAWFPEVGALAPADKLVIAYFTLISVLVALSPTPLSAWWLLIGAHAAVITAIVAIAMWPGGRTQQFVRAWYAAVLVPLSFKELEYLIPRLHPRDFDWQLAAIDYKVFGVHPTLWLEQFTYPVLTELFQFSYICYYFLPLVLGIPLWRKQKLAQFQFLLFLMVLAFYLSYLGYLAVPAIGPRFILRDQQSFPLEGVLFYKPIRDALDWVEGITRDCFPSGHTALTLLVLFYAAKINRRVFWIILPICTALIISTVYLRYHYVIDVVAGVALAAGVMIVARPLYRRLGGGYVED